ncbi:hypothetical protein [Calothrix sp. PCC 7507]|uniref:hypothetical protein n=1 Tax=Calothrix sp. PCC 7507 TaxID=99598 RepID=UPI00029EF725|nr:hypothetical protein [Calothrix sp. PCC 7507]AFY35872.1 hypothetical protein Cal7507_5545 [Calothrix sp. PCC 7507]
MFSKSIFWVSLAGFGLTETSHTSQFRYIEQPVWLKIGVAIAGFALIALELWWFFLSKPIIGDREQGTGNRDK